MILELAAPASLPLGVAQINGQPALLALTVQHPPVHLEAQAGHRLQITGPRAHIAHAFASRYTAYHALTPGVEIEIELAIPAAMGLGSDGMLALSMAHTLAWAHQLPEADPQTLAHTLALPLAHAGEIAGYGRGGLLLVQPASEARILRRVEIAHPERDAWAFVFHLPHPPETLPDAYETNRLETLLKAAPYLPLGTSQMVDTLFRAVDENDIAAFGHGLMTLQQAARDALVAMGAAVKLSSEEQAIFSLMQAAGAVAWGRSLGGYGLWGLIQGGDPSRTLRKRLTEHVGIFGGRVMATITDNRGARFIEKPGRLGLENPIRPKPGIS
jgi:predicted sugar kinase